MFNSEEYERGWSDKEVLAAHRAVAKAVRDRGPEMDGDQTENVKRHVERDVEFEHGL